MEPKSLIHFLFLSTPSARRATALPGDFLVLFFISIHALREEGDHSVNRHPVQSY